jgi:spermidine synthase
MTGEKPAKALRPSWPPGDWYVDASNHYDLTGFLREKVLVTGKTRFQEYEIFENRLWGRLLILDGRLQSAEQDEFIYHEALVHPALLAHPGPRRVLVLGGGEGATLREVLRHPGVERAVMVDIDEELVILCREWLPTFHAGALEDPRVELVFADGRAWLAAEPEAVFEVIILDLPEPLEEGPALKLFTREMYGLIRSKLAPGGLVAVQSGSAGLGGRLMPDLHATLRAVFPQVMAYTAFVPSFMDLYGFHLAGMAESFWPQADELEARFRQRRLSSLRWLGPEFAAALPQLPVYLSNRLEQEGRVLTDAAPFDPRSGERWAF